MGEALTSIGRYEIISELGAGAMARVYLARDPNIDRKIALKVLEPRGLVAELEMDELRNRFLVEARAAGNLRHASAVAIYDADYDPRTGYSFIAMEWVDGQSLDQFLKGPERLSLEQATTIICQVAGALDAAHAQGLIHRDIKPANILLDNASNAKLSDFGIAKIESLELTSTGQVLGTPFYMSPEQIRDEPLDGRSDLFSLGVVLYQCVTGELPFRSDSLPALTHKILNVDPRPPRFIDPKLPEHISSALNKALSKAPEDRFQSGADLAVALGREIVPAESTGSVTMRSSQLVPKPERGGEVPRSSPWHGLMGTLALVAIVIAALVGLWATEQDRFARPQKGAKTEISPQAATTPATGKVPTTTGSQVAETMPETGAPISVTDSDEPDSLSTATASTLEISYTNRLKQATVDVWVDGRHVLARSVSRSGGLVRRAVGRKFFQSIPVAPGHHDVRVRIKGSEGKIEAANWSGNTFHKGQTRRLRLELIPPKYLKMTWK